MGGKAALLLVVGFSLTFLIAAKNFGTLSTRAVENMTDYYDQITLYNLAVSGANLAANEIFFDPTWDDEYHNLDYNGGKIDVEVESFGTFGEKRKITSTATYEGRTKSVIVSLQPSKFSRFAYFSVSEGSSIWWTSGDTVYGPFHTQDYLRVAYQPVFWGKVTTKRGLLKYTSSKVHSPKFYGGYEKGVNLPLPSDGVQPVEDAADDDGYKFSGHDTVYITFAGNNIKYRYTWNGVDSVRDAATFAPNGVIFADDAVVRLKGEVKGQYTLGCSGTSGKGTVYLDDDIVYSEDPRTHPHSTDMLGIVAKQKVLITNNAVNNSDINIHASIYAEKGGFGAQNYDTRPISGSINLLGGIIQNDRQAVGTFSGGTINHGFNKKYRYDERFLLSSPPMFPGTGGFEIVSWLE